MLRFKKNRMVSVWLGVGLAGWGSAWVASAQTAAPFAEITPMAAPLSSAPATPRSSPASATGSTPRPAARTPSPSAAQKAAADRNAAAKTAKAAKTAAAVKPVARPSTAPVLAPIAAQAPAHLTAPVAPTPPVRVSAPTATLSAPPAAAETAILADPKAEALPSAARVVVMAMGQATAGTPLHSAFESVLSTALETNPQVRSALAQAQGAKLDVDAAKWAYWPTVSVNAQKTDADRATDSNASTVTVQQPLWAGGALSSRVAATEKLDQASAEQVSVVRSELALRLVDVWASLLEAEANRGVTERTLDGLKRYEALMKRRVAGGLSSSVDLRLLAVRISRAQTELSDAQASVQVAVQRMEQIVGASVAATALADLRQPLVQRGLGEWVQTQSAAAGLERLSQHPAVRKAELDAAAAADELAVQKAERWPKLVLSYQHRLGSLPANVPDRGQVSLGLNYTPGAGFSSFSKSAAESARLQARLEAVDSVRREKREQLLVDWAALQREFDRGTYLGTTTDSAREVLASYERLYMGGLKSWLEVLNALQELSQSELRQAQAANAATLAYYRWRLRSGELPTNANWTR